MHCKRNRKKRALTMHSLTQVGPDVRVVLFIKSGGGCYYCGTPLTLATLTADHIQPVRLGGCAILDNLVAACRLCNTAKGSLTLDAFRARRGGKPFWGEQRCHERTNGT